MILDGVELPLEALPEHFAGLPVVEKPGHSADAVMTDVRLTSGDLLLPEQEFVRRFLEPAEVVLGDAISKNGPHRFKAVSFKATVGNEATAPYVAAVLVTAWAYIVRH